MGSLHTVGGSGSMVTKSLLRRPSTRHSPLVRRWPDLKTASAMGAGGGAVGRFFSLILPPCAVLSRFATLRGAVEAAF